MKKVLRLINAELRKIFLRPTIFIMIAGLLIVSLITALVYKPADRENTIAIDVSGDDIAEMYSNFKLEDANANDSVASYNKALSDALLGIQFFTNEEDVNSVLNQFLLKVDEAEAKYYQLSEALARIEPPGTLFNKTDTHEKLSNYKTTLENLSTLYQLSFKNATQYLIKEETYKTGLAIINNHISKIQTFGANQQPDETYINLRSSLRETRFYDESHNFFHEVIDKIAAKTITDEQFASLKTNYYDETVKKIGSIDESENETESAKGTLIDDIYRYYQENKTANGYKAKSEFRKLIANYKSSVLMCISVMEEKVNLIVVGDKSDKDIQEYVGYSSFSKMETKSSVTKYDYLLFIGAYEIDYLDALPTGVNSGNETNLYDYLAYSMNAISILVILFCVLIASKLIAGEQTGGTMKLLAIRPYSRTKILFGKLMTTIVFAIIFLGFGIVVNSLVGLAVFGVPAESLMLGVFNGTNVLCTHPIVFILLQTLFLIIKIGVYVSLAIMISVCFRSYLGASMVSFSVIAVTLLLNGLLRAKFWYKYFPMPHFDLFKYFTTTTETSGFYSVFSSPLVADSNFFVSLAVVLGLTLVFNLISFITFKKKDIA